MRLATASWVFVAAALALGCSAGSADSIGAPPAAGGAQGSAGNGGSIGPANDAGYVGKGGAAATDASSHRDASTEPVGSNLTADAVTFNWDTLACLGCSGGGGAVGGGGTGGSSSSGTSANGSGGKSAAGGSSGGGGAVPNWDAAAPVGGSAAGGASAGNGGRVGAGGAAGGGAGIGGGSDAGVPAMDAGVSADLPRGDAGLPTYADAASDASRPDLISGPDAKPGDLGVSCQARIVPVIPVLDRIDRLVAGENTQVVLRAVADVGGPLAGSTWTWGAYWESSPFAVAQLGAAEPDTAAFAVSSPGRYLFTARSGNCYAELPGFAVAPNVCTNCDKSVVLRAAPPINSSLPTQSGGISIDEPNVILSPGVAVTVVPSIDSRLVKSYVRINDTSGGLVADGMADTTVGGFVTRLRLLDSARVVLRYDVLVVPLDGEDGATIAATAPELYRSKDPTTLNAKSPLVLAGGFKVTGTVLDVNGQPVADARVVLTNQEPSSAKQRADLVFSSVGRSDAQGTYALYVQPGAYWVSFSPPLDGGLPEVISDSSVIVTGDSTLSFQWSSAATAALALRVVDAMGVPVEGTSVRVTSSSQSSNVGVLSGSLISSQQARGDVEVQETTDATGTVLFPKLPASADYAVLLMPSVPGPYAATTATTVRLEADGTSTQVSLSAQAMIRGKLVARVASLPIDFTTVAIVGYDRSLDAPEAARATAVNADGSFAFGVTPRRPYVLMAVPAAGSGYARSFVGPGPMQASEFVVTQNLLTSLPWKAKVVDDNRIGIADTALQAYCDPSWPNCVDPTVPLAETMADAGGSFQLELADPASRL